MGKSLKYVKRWMETDWLKTPWLWAASRSPLSLHDRLLHYLISLSIVFKNIPFIFVRMGNNKFNSSLVNLEVSPSLGNGKASGGHQFLSSNVKSGLKSGFKIFHLRKFKYEWKFSNLLWTWIVFNLSLSIVAMNFITYTVLYWCLISVMQCTVRELHIG